MVKKTIAIQNSRAVDDVDIVLSGPHVLPKRAADSEHGHAVF